MRTPGKISLKDNRMGIAAKEEGIIFTIVTTKAEKMF